MATVEGLLAQIEQIKTDAATEKAQVEKDTADQKAAADVAVAALQKQIDDLIAAGTTGLDSVSTGLTELHGLVRGIRPDVEIPPAESV